MFHIQYWEADEYIIMTPNGVIMPQTFHKAEAMRLARYFNDISEAGWRVEKCESSSTAT